MQRSFLCTCQPSLCLLGKMSIQIFCPFLIRLFVLLLSYEFFIYFGYYSLIRYMLHNYFLSFSRLLLHFFVSFLSCGEVFGLIQLQLFVFVVLFYSFFAFIALDLGVTLKNSLPLPVSKSSVTTYVFFQEFYGFRSCVQVFNLF